MQKKSKIEKNPNLGFAKSSKLKILSVMLNSIAKISVKLSAWVTLKFFLMPQRYPKPEWERKLESQGCIRSLKFCKRNIYLYEWGQGPIILLVHSWSGRGTQLGSFVPRLVEAGYKVVAFDGPAHGRSSGKQTDMIEFASIITAIQVEYKAKLKAVIGHSFGAATSMLAIRDFSLDTEKLVTIGCFSHGIWVTEIFGQLLYLKKDIIAKMRDQLEKSYAGKFRWKNLAPIEMVKIIGDKLMIIHDENDYEVPYSHGLALKNAASYASFVTTKGCGHRRILKNENVINQILQFIAS